MKTNGTRTIRSREPVRQSLGGGESAKQSGQSGTAFADFGGDTFYRYTYNTRGELTQAVGYLGRNVETLTAPLPGRNFQYGYDNLGNRMSANTTGVSGLAADYTANNRNQITARENHYVPVSGTVDSDAKVVVGGALAGQQGKYWSGEVLLDNTSGPAYSDTIAVKAAKPGTPDVKEISGLLAAFLEPASETLTYDLDGNLLTDGRWNYQWDAENRLVQMETASAAMTAGLPGKRLVFRYDSLNRRTVKEVWNWSGSSWSLASEVRFVYQGWNLVAEMNSSGVRQRTHAWGLDLSGSLGAMGGIGALLQSVDHTGTATAYLPGYDGSGNVAAMMQDNGTIVAAYEYGPFGEPLRSAGAYAATNPFRKATKYTDEESGLVYYGHRYYSASLGRFINRDPIGEQGGINLYAFVGNDPVNRWDYLGLDDDDEVVVMKDPYVVRPGPEPRGGWGFAFLSNVMGGENYSFDLVVSIPITEVLQDLKETVAKEVAKVKEMEEAKRKKRCAELLQLLPRAGLHHSQLSSAVDNIEGALGLPPDLIIYPTIIDKERTRAPTIADEVLMPASRLFMDNRHWTASRLRTLCSFKR